MFTEKIKAKEYYIKDLFSDKFLFEIPDYQRAYSWNRENLNQLVDDIEESIELNRNEFGDTFESYEPYFIGSIVLCSKEFKDDGWGLYDVIDGQQRLTSIIMLIACLRDMIDSEDYKTVLSSLIYQKPNELLGIKESLRVKVRGKELDFFKEYILSMGGTLKLINEDKSEFEEAKVNMITAVEVFREKFLDEEGNILKDKINSFIKYLLQKVVLVVITTDSFTSAFRLFNVINARGLPLTNSDLLKSENLRVISSDIRAKYADMWEADEADLGKDNMEMIIGFIRTMKLKKKANTTVFEEFNKNIFVNDPGYRGIKFVEHIHSVKEIYSSYILDASINTGNKADDIYYKNLITIMRRFLPYDEWMAAVVRFVEKFNDDSMTLEFVKALEKRIVIDWVNGNSFADRLTRVYKIIDAIDNCDNGLDVKKADIFTSDIDRTAAYFENSLNDIEFYSKGRMMVPKYILIRLDMEMARDKEVSYSDKIMLEHILPRNAKDVYWTTNFTNEQRRNYANRLGNLVLITGTKSTKSNNKAFAEKMSSYILKKGNFNITKEIAILPDWNIENMKNRQKDLTERCKQLFTKF